MKRAQDFSENCNAQVGPIRHVLEKYIPLIQWKEDGANIIDVGCGPGDTTVDVLLPFLPPNYKQLIAVDISKEMVEFAENKFGKERIEFRILDITTNKLPSELVGKFDHVFSLFCLHWVVDQRQAFANFSHLLKPGGNMLLTFMADVTHFQVYEILYQTEKWRKHMKHYEQYLCPYMHIEKPEDILRDLLESNDFNIKVCTSFDGDLYFQDRHSLKVALRSVNPFIEYMSEEMQVEFLEDVVKEQLKKINWSGNNTGEVLIPYKLCVIVAEKKK